jgi:hypothetical protein
MGINMEKAILICLLTFIFSLTIFAQAVYVDGTLGDDKNPGTKESPVHSIHRAAEMIKSRDNNFYTMKINPGIYVLDHYVSVAMEKDMAGKRIIIEAAFLPGDTSWTPEKMPVIASKAKKGEIPDSYHFVASFLINESHVTIRGIKFHGYFYPNTRYFPIARFNKAKTDLFVEQCMFVGDENISQIQAGIIGHGNEIRLDHCVFYKIRNVVVFFQPSTDGIKTGNGITNSIIYGAKQGVWTAWPDKDFIFENNIVSNCKHVWVKNYFNTSKNYSIDNCVIVNNQFYKMIADSTGVLVPGEYEIKENNVTKKGEISLRLIENNVDQPLPIDYLHIIPNTLGYDIGAGLFKDRKK